MSTSANPVIALLRGINVGGANKLPMAGLRALCADLGWTDVGTYIQSGNVVARAAGSRAKVEDELETGIAGRFGMKIPVIVRTLSEWQAYIESNPFPAEIEREARWVALHLSKMPPEAGAVIALREKAAHGERVEQVGDAFWVYYPAGMGRSKLTPALFDRLSGSPVTARNWRTVLRLAELAGAPSQP